MSNNESKLLVKRPAEGLNEWTFGVWDIDNETLIQLPGAEIEEAVFDAENRRLISWFNVNSSDSEESDDDAQTGVVTIWDLYAPDTTLQQLNNLSEIKEFDLSGRVMFIIMDNRVQIWNLDALKDMLENLTPQQIKFLLWLYEQKGTEVLVDGQLSVYESLPSDLKNIVLSVFSFGVTNEKNLKE